VRVVVPGVGRTVAPLSGGIGAVCLAEQRGHVDADVCDKGVAGVAGQVPAVGDPVADVRCVVAAAGDLVAFVGGWVAPL